MGKRGLVALRCLSSWCLVMVVWFFFAVPRVCLLFVIVVFPDHTLLQLLALILLNPKDIKSQKILVGRFVHVAKSLHMDGIS